MPDILGFQVKHYRVETPVYQGPLDLLLQLIERAELDITKIALAQITDQYLAHLAEMGDRSPEEVSAFLVIAARLVQIKSEALLPRPQQAQPTEEGDTGEALVRQLQTYRRFKQAAAWLRARQEAGQHAFTRLASPPTPTTPRLIGQGLTADALAAAARRAFSLRPRLPLGKVITPPKVTIRQRARAILHALIHRGRATFFALLGRQPNRLEAVVTFLALLELVKQRIVHARQEALFADIEILPARDDLSPDLDIASEFGE